MRAVPQQTSLAALEGLVPLAPMPIEPAPEVAVLPMRGWVRRKLPKFDEHEMMGMTSRDKRLSNLNISWLSKPYEQQVTLLIKVNLYNLSRQLNATSTLNTLYNLPQIQTQ